MSGIFRSRPKQPGLAPKTKFTVTVRAYDGDPIRDSKIQGARVVWDGATPGEGETDGAGNFTLPPQPAQGFNVTVSGGQTDPPADGTFGAHWTGVALTGDIVIEAVLPFEAAPVEVPPPVVNPVPPQALQRVQVVGRIFRTADGTPWRWKLSSAFFALQRWDRGQNLDPLVAWTQDIGSNGWRVFCQFFFANPSDPLRPRQISPRRMAEFADWCARRGLSVEFTFKTDTQAGGFNESLQDEIDDVRNIRDELAAEPNVFGEVKNEPFKNGGRIVEICDALGLREKRNRPFPMSTGDYNIVGNEAGFFALDYVGDHPSRKADWPAEACKTGHFVYDGWGPDANSPGWRGFRGQDVTIVADEAYGAAEVDVPGRRDANANNHEDSGAGFAVGGSGGTFHADDLAGNLVVPGPNQTACGRRYFAAMDFFPADAFLGTYVHQDFPDHPLVKTTEATEIAGRILGNRAYMVAAQPTDRWEGVAVNGWRIVKQGGHRGNLLILERT